MYDDGAPKNGFQRWLDRMCDELGVDVIPQKQAAKLLGKSETSIGYYVAGTRKPTRDLRLLMTAIAQGAKPTPWPE